MGRVSLFEAPTQIVVTNPALVERELQEGKIPALGIRLSLVSLWWYYADDDQAALLMRIALVDPANKVHWTEDKEETRLQAVPDHIDVAPTFVQLNGIPFYGWGIYHFHVQTKSERPGARWSTVAKVPFRVRKPPQAD